MTVTRLKWEVLEESDQLKVMRVPLPSGWLVNITNNLSHLAACYVPDKTHDWLRDKNLPLSITPINTFDTLCIPINELPISTRAKNCLRRAGFMCVGDIVCNEQMIQAGSFYNLSLLKEMGNKTYQDIINALEKFGFKNPIKNDEYFKMRGNK